jgi:hypothetical protein
MKLHSLEDLVRTRWLIYQGKNARWKNEGAFGTKKYLFEEALLFFD